MERNYNHDTGKHELILSSDELDLVYRGLDALAGIDLLQSSITHPTIETAILRKMREVIATERGHQYPA